MDENHDCGNKEDSEGVDYDDEEAECEEEGEGKEEREEKGGVWPGKEDD